MEFAVELLDPQQRSDAVLAVAQLIHDELISGTIGASIYPTPEAYLAQRQTPEDVFYAYVEPETGVIGGAAVVHDESAEGEARGVTRIYEIAVRRDRQREGIGNRLVEHIALQGLERGDTMVGGYAINTAFAASIGFPVHAESGPVTMPLSHVLHAASEYSRRTAMRKRRAGMLL